MSASYASKHDLSFNIAKLDLETLIKAAGIAVHTARLALNRAMSKYDNEWEHHDINTPEGKDTCIAHQFYDACHIFEYAEALRLAAENYHFLHACLERENIEIIKPETGGE